MSKRTFYIIGGALLFVACLGFFALAGGVLLIVGLRSYMAQPEVTYNAPFLPELEEILPQVEENLPELDEILPNLEPGAPALPSGGNFPFAQAGSGLVVLDVDPDSPAAQVGLQFGDVLTELDGQPLDSAAALDAVLVTLAPGQEVELTYQRDGQTQTANITLADNAGAAYLGVSVDEGGWARGMQGLGIEALIVRSVTPGSPAEAAGLQPGDQITAVNGEAIGSGRALREVVQSLQPGAALSLTVVSGEQEAREVEVTLADSPDTPGLPYLGITFEPVMRFRQEMAPGQDGEVTPGGQEGEMHRNWPFGPNMPIDPENMPMNPQDAPGMFRQMRSALVVQSVAAGSPAEASGLAAGDMILAIDGQTPTGTQAFLENIAARSPGDTLTLSVFSTAEMAHKEVTVTLGEDPAAPGQGFLGLTAAGMAELHEQFMPRFFQPEGGEGDF